MAGGQPRGHRPLVCAGPDLHAQGRGRAGRQAAPEARPAGRAGPLTARAPRRGPRVPHIQLLRRAHRRRARHEDRHRPGLHDAHRGGGRGPHDADRRGVAHGPRRGPVAVGGGGALPAPGGGGRRARLHGGGGARRPGGVRAGPGADRRHERHRAQDAAGERAAPRLPGARRGVPAPQARGGPAGFLRPTGARHPHCSRGAGRARPGARRVPGGAPRRVPGHLRHPDGVVVPALPRPRRHGGGRPEPGDLRVEGRVGLVPGALPRPLPGRPRPAGPDPHPVDRVAQRPEYPAGREPRGRAPARALAGRQVPGAARQAGGGGGEGGRRLHAGLPLGPGRGRGLRVRPQGAGHSGGQTAHHRGPVPQALRLPLRGHGSAGGGRAHADRRPGGFAGPAVRAGRARGPGAG